MAKTKKVVTKIYGLEMLPEIVAAVKERLKNPIVTFTGPLGAGKTTLIKELMRQLGVEEDVTSPTFTYMNQYNSRLGKIYHFDLYRIKNMQDFIDAGFTEYLDEPGALTVIEWPEVIAPMLTHNVMHISIDYDQDPQKRKIVISK